MDDQPKDRGAEAFSLGAVAVVNSGNNQSPEEPPPNSKPMSSKLGSLAVSSADQKLLEPGEHLVKIVRRHPIGVIGIYIEMFAGVGILAAVVILALAGTFGQMSTSTKGLVAAGGVLLAGFLAAILMLSIYVYRQSRLLIADKSLVSIVQKALFSKKIARLSMANVEDVTCDQKGILQSLLNYGTLTIQTAGQEDNFIFPFCPSPNDTADQILEARQAFVRAKD